PRQRASASGPRCDALGREGPAIRLAAGIISGSTPRRQVAQATTAQRHLSIPALALCSTGAACTARHPRALLPGVRGDRRGKSPGTRLGRSLGELAGTVEAVASLALARKIVCRADG